MRLGKCIYIYISYINFFFLINFYLLNYIYYTYIYIYINLFMHRSIFHVSECEATQSADLGTSSKESYWDS